MIRFSFFVFPLLVLILGLSSYVLSSLGMIAANQIIDRFPPALLLASFCLEACGLLALFLLIERRSSRWWLDGLLAGWVAWIFRGPLLVMILVMVARQNQDIWWTMVLSWFITYSSCGLVMASVYRLFLPEEIPAEEIPAEEAIF